MAFKIEGGTAYFSSGRTAYCNAGIIGIDPDLELSEGYDGGFSIDPYNTGPITPDERREMAEYMIDLWRRYAALETSK